MSDTNALDLRGFISGAMNEVFDTMLSMDLGWVDGNVQTTLQGERIVGSVSFAGMAVGSVNIEVNEAFGRCITAAMLGMEEDEVGGEEEIHDVIGELSNMVGGDLNSRLCDEGFSCELSIPSITTGKDFRMESKGWQRHESLAFQHGEHLALVNVYLKTMG